MFNNKMLALVSLWLLVTLVPLAMPQCLTPKDSVRKISESAADSLLQSELRFSTDLLHKVSSLYPDKNIIFSPTSVFKALLLAYFISANHTEDSLKKALHLAAKEDKLDVMGAYTVQNYYDKLRSIQSQTYQLNCANRLYVDKSVRVQPCMKVLFADELSSADFKTNAENVVKKINQWVADKTRKVIKNFLTNNQVTQDTDLVLVNAAYFKGAWKYKFNKEATSDRSFYLSNGTKVKTQMMMQDNKFKLIVDKALDAEVLELPYDGDDISMFILKPNEPGPSAVEHLVKRINAENLLDMVKTLNTSSPDHHYVTMPKFTAEQTLQLTMILESIGVGDLFKESADLRTLAGDGDLSFSEATHKAKVRVNEAGTEAAAATAIIGNRMGSDDFIADSPFVYILYDKTSNVILFFGIYSFPE